MDNKSVRQGIHSNHIEGRKFDWDSPLSHWLEKQGVRKKPRQTSTQTTEDGDDVIITGSHKSMNPTIQMFDEVVTFPE